MSKFKYKVVRKEFDDRTEHVAMFAKFDEKSWKPVADANFQFTKMVEIPVKKEKVVSLKGAVDYFIPINSKTESAALDQIKWHKEMVKLQEIEDKKKQPIKQEEFLVNEDNELITLEPNQSILGLNSDDNIPNKTSNLQIITLDDIKSVEDFKKLIPIKNVEKQEDYVITILQPDYKNGKETEKNRMEIPMQGFQKKLSLSKNLELTKIKEDYVSIIKDISNNSKEVVLDLSKDDLFKTLIKTRHLLIESSRIGPLNRLIMSSVIYKKYEHFISSFVHNICQNPVIIILDDNFNEIVAYRKNDLNQPGASLLYNDKKYNLLPIGYDINDQFIRVVVPVEENFMVKMELFSDEDILSTSLKHISIRGKGVNYSNENNGLNLKFLKGIYGDLISNGLLPDCDITKFFQDKTKTITISLFNEVGKEVAKYDNIKLDEKSNGFEIDILEHAFEKMFYEVLFKKNDLSEGVIPPYSSKLEQDINLEIKLMLHSAGYEKIKLADDIQFGNYRKNICGLIPDLIIDTTISVSDIFQKIIDYLNKIDPTQKSHDGTVYFWYLQLTPDLTDVNGIRKKILVHWNFIENSEPFHIKLEVSNNEGVILSTSGFCASIADDVKKSHNVDLLNKVYTQLILSAKEESLKLQKSELLKPNFLLSFSVFNREKQTDKISVIHTLDLIYEKSSLLQEEIIKKINKETFQMIYADELKICLTLLNPSKNAFSISFPYKIFVSLDELELHQYIHSLVLQCFNEEDTSDIIFIEYCGIFSNISKRREPLKCKFYKSECGEFYIYENIFVRKDRIFSVFKKDEYIDNRSCDTYCALTNDEGGLKLFTEKEVIELVKNSKELRVKEESLKLGREDDNIKYFKEKIESLNRELEETNAKKSVEEEILKLDLMKERLDVFRSFSNLKLGNFNSEVSYIWALKHILCLSYEDIESVLKAKEIEEKNKNESLNRGLLKAKKQCELIDDALHVYKLSKDDGSENLLKYTQEDFDRLVEKKDKSIIKCKLGAEIYLQGFNYALNKELNEEQIRSIMLRLFKAKSMDELDNIMKQINSEINNNTDISGEK